MSWHKDRHIDKWNRIENEEIKLLHLWTIHFGQRYQDNSINGAKKSVLFTCKKMKLNLYFIPHAKVHSKRSKGVYRRANSIKLLKENIGVNFPNLRLGHCLLDMTPKAKAIKEKKVSWTSSKLKIFRLQRLTSRE